MYNPTVSVFIPVHNEEKTIRTALAFVQKIKKEYKNIEIIVGSDSTDRTDDIVREYKFVKLVTSKERLGKPGMLKRLYKVAKGEIIIIHDSDWKFISHHDFRNLIKIFEDPKVGGIDDVRSLPEENLPTLSLGETFVNRFLYEFRIKKYTFEKDGMLYAKDNSKFPFIVTIFRRSSVPKEQLTLCDDGERAVQIMKNGYDVIIPKVSIPYFLINYVRPLTVRTLFKQKARCSLARRQMQKIYNQYNAGILDFFIPAFLYSINRSFEVKAPKISRFKTLVSVFSFWFISGLADIKGRTLKASTKEAWKMRCPR
jgi:glycosyltransferase involved in cell wall biosynthesis